MNFFTRDLTKNLFLQFQTFHIGFYNRQRWNDPRLMHNGTVDEIVSNVHPGGKIWIPDVYVVNSRAAKYINQFSRTVIKRNGDVYFSILYVNFFFSEIPILLRETPIPVASSRILHHLATSRITQPIDCNTSCNMSKRNNNSRMILIFSSLGIHSRRLFKFSSSRLLKTYGLLEFYTEIIS